MRYLILGLLIACGDPGPTPLFNGEDLTGWYTWRPTYGRDVDPDGMFAITDGNIHFLSQDIAPAAYEFGYLATTRDYTNFHLSFEYKWGERLYVNFGRDAGLFFAAVGPDQLWPRSVECQVMVNDSGSMYLFDYATLETTIDPANPTPTYLEGGTPYVAPRNALHNYARVARGPVVDSSTEWNTVEVIARGQDAEFIVNGTTTFRSTGRMQPHPDFPDDPAMDVPLTGGRLVLQQEGSEVMFRNLLVEELP
ncbi:MAG: DUF1080 domain-containing protein [Kofleriaceae bacterium]